MVKALIQAYQQALINGARGGAAGAGGASRSIRGRIAVEEASEILGVKKDAGLKDIYKSYGRLFKKNDPKNGGSIYIQAKIHNAKVELEKQAIARGEQPPAPPTSPPDPAERHGSSSKST